MPDDVYKRLAHHLDQLPAGFPPTDDGLELRILKHLFCPEEAELALHLSLIPERASVIALRAGIPEDQAEEMLVIMAQKGLIADIVKENRPTRFMAAQFVIGIWEYQVNRLKPELIRDVDEYFKRAFDLEAWRKVPQLRTIPIKESIHAPAEVMLYEDAEQLVLSHHTFAVAPCICRQERKLVGEGCDKPMDMCLIMGGGADNYVRHERGRYITQQEALQILETANQAGLVLQPANSQQAANICCCCGDCCGVLRTVKRHPQPASLLSSAFYAFSDPQLCSLCMDCEDRCQMEAIGYDEGYALVDLDRCIGCGLCITTCSTGAMQLMRKPADELPDVPQNGIETYLRLGRARGVITNGKIAKTVVKSGTDRLKSKF
jgi:electron transport complex protein RnfB